MPLDPRQPPGVAQRPLPSMTSATWSGPARVDGRGRAPLGAAARVQGARGRAYEPCEMPPAGVRTSKYREMTDITIRDVPRSRVTSSWHGARRARRWSSTCFGARDDGGGPEPRGVPEPGRVAGRRARSGREIGTHLTVEEISPTSTPIVGEPEPGFAVVDASRRWSRRRRTQPWQLAARAVVAAASRPRALMASRRPRVRRRQVGPPTRDRQRRDTARSAGRAFSTGHTVGLLLGPGSGGTR